MRKVLVSLVSLITLVSLVSLTSCKKEENGNGTQFRATMEDCTSTKTELDGTALNWVAGDLIKVYGNTGSGIYTATPQTPATVAIFNNVSGETGNAPFRAYYPYTLTTDGMNITLPSVQVSENGSLTEFPMYAESSNSELAFKNLCGVLKLHLTKANINISSIAITANNEANGTYSIDYNGGNPELTYEENGTNTTMLVCSTAQAIDEGADFYIYLPPTVDSIKNIVLTADDGSVCTKTVHSTVKVNVNRSQYTLVTFGETDMIFVEPLPEGALPGLFSVSASQQVHFSKGILQYQASTDTWRFAEEQFASGSTGWQSSFGWGTGLNPTLSSDDVADYQTFVDWGVNTISNGGDQPNQWRTLSINEWNYLFYHRPNSGSLYGWGTVNGHFGVIVLPDDWTLPSGCTFYSSGAIWDYPYEGEDFRADLWSGNILNYTSQWEVMEAAGAVFLPTDWEYYWSSTIFEDDYSLYNYSACCVRLDNSMLWVFAEEGNASLLDVNDQTAVRLVRNN